MNDNDFEKFCNDIRFQSMKIKLDSMADELKYLRQRIDFLEQMFLTDKITK